jgi:FkbM family methyltransferase
MRSAIASAYKYFSLFGIGGVIARATRNGQPFQASVPGHRHDVTIRLGTTDVGAFKHVFIDEEYALPLDRNMSIVIDAGANCGMSAVYFALRYPLARIYAIEPDPSNFAILKKNAQSFPQITPIHAALWSRDGYLGVIDPGEGHWAIRVEDRKSQTVVPALTIPTMLRQYGIDHIGLLKLDIEGAECETLAFASEWIGCVDAICAELHDRFRDGCSRAFEVATIDFPIRWTQGELHCVARKSCAA